MRPATKGSLSLDLATAVDVTLIDQRPQRIQTCTLGSVLINGKPQGALLIGRSSSGIKGLFILPGITDADFEGTISIVVQTLFPPVHIPMGSKIDQLVPLPHLTEDMEALSAADRGTAGFGSTGGLVLLTMAMNRHPVTTATLGVGGEQISLEVLLDTGADLTIIDNNCWPRHWPLLPMARGVEGVGGHSSILRSKDHVRVVIEGRTASTNITVMALPQGVNGLIGRDVLDQLGVILTTN